MIMEKANARLKNKWRRVKKIYTASNKRTKDIIIGCIVVHNIVLQQDCTTDRSDVVQNNYIPPNMDDARSNRDFISNRYF